MYNSLKKIINTFLPKRAIFKIEPFLRSGWSLFYRGSEYECTICNTKLKKWIILHNQDKICPNCGSLARDRRLWQLIENSYLTEDIKVLDFSPSRCLYRKWKKQNASYNATDLSGDFISDNQYDITSIPEDDNTFDLILCYHVLEHVADDLSAMKELHRTLKPTGTLFVQTPFKEGEIYEDYTITSTEDRLRHFGQEDHVRIYSIEGLKSRLIQSGFETEVNQYQDKNLFYGLAENETILIMKKRK